MTSLPRKTKARSLEDLGATNAEADWSPTWYIKPDIGNDEWDGLSPTHIEGTNHGPWKTSLRGIQHIVDNSFDLSEEDRRPIEGVLNVIGYGVLFWLAVGLGVAAFVLVLA